MGETGKSLNLLLSEDEFFKIKRESLLPFAAGAKDLVWSGEISAFDLCGNKCLKKVMSSIRFFQKGRSDSLF